ncbi:leucine zipper domain-containing protein [Paenarthrobacter nicotinovorans]|uniref:leucine zipper domain-containing protein n=1 Tax=Paenarthrobacter nicotinovorans TaxID=29320 RepID=UPI003D66C2B6
MLTPKARLKLAQLVVAQHWTITESANFFKVSWPTAKRWTTRYLEHGPDGMSDRSSLPRRSPNRAPRELVKHAVALRWRKRLGPVQIAGLLVSVRFARRAPYVEATSSACTAFDSRILTKSAGSLRDPRRPCL